MEKCFVIEPLAGIRAGIRFGMSREDVRHMLAPATPNAFKRGTTEIDGFYDATFQVNYDTEGKVDFIEVAAGPGSSAVLDGIDLLKLEASRVIGNLAVRYRVATEENEIGYSYCFPDIELALWRPVVPDSAGDEESRFFESVGIGRSGYYSEKMG